MFNKFNVQVCLLFDNKFFYLFIIMINENNYFDTKYIISYVTNILIKCPKRDTEFDAKIIEIIGFELWLFVAFISS